jgi:hypothetical protein
VPVPTTFLGLFGTPVGDIPSNEGIPEAVMVATREGSQDEEAGRVSETTGTVRLACLVASCARMLEDPSDIAV